MEEKSLIPGRIILQILTMRNSIQDFPPSSEITGFVSLGVELHHEASGHTNLIGYLHKDDFNIRVSSIRKMTPWLIFRSQTPSNISDKEEHNGHYQWEYFCDMCC